MSRVPEGPWLKVCARKCDQCLFSKDKIVDDHRRDEIVADLKEQDTHFFCHKGTLKGVERVCHGSLPHEATDRTLFRAYRCIRFHRP